LTRSHTGVGVATLYRRFPDRQSLVVALFELELLKTIELAKAALAADDPWEGFTTILRSVAGTAATDRGMREALLSSRHGLGAATPNKVELVRLLSLTVVRAQRNGSLRKGITARDIPIMILMVSVVADFAANANPRVWERYCALLIDGLSAHGNRHPLAPDAMLESEMELAASLW
jgi:AcrR family transcriptional regulator